MSRVPNRPARRAVRAAAASPAVAGFRPAGAALAVAAAFAVHSGSLQAQSVPTGAIHGSATFLRNGNNLLVTTVNGAGTNHSAINWQNFSVPSGSTTYFQQPSAASTSINRVLGPDPSAIFGTLGSNGKLVLVNPAGIAVGKGALVDTAGFTASTLGMSDADAIAGRLAFAGDGAGVLQVDGHVIARGGDVVLIGSKVQAGSEAVVQADGAVVLAAGRKAEITGRGLEGIRLEVQAGNEAVNLGTLQGDAVGMFANTLTHSGLVRAQAVSMEGGRVVLKATGGDAFVSGTVDAAAAGGKGGSIDVLGERVGLMAGAQLEASGTAGGGQVRVGGDYQGQNADVPNAKAVYVDAAAKIRADAAGGGDGGRVIVWSDDATRMHGEISARGGDQGGNGGFAEVSGKQYLEFKGGVDLRAANGTAGTLLLDPNDITIVATGSTTVPNSPTASVFSGGPDVAEIVEADLERQLLNSSVIIATNGNSTGIGGNITVASGVSVDWSTPNTLGLQADKGVDIQGDLRGAGAGSAISIQAFGGSVTQAATSVIQADNLVVNAPAGAVLLDGQNLVKTLAGNTAQANGAFSFTNAQSLTIGTVGTPYGAQRSGISAGTGDVRVATTTGNLTVNAPPPPSPTPAPVPAAISGGNVQLVAAGSIDVLGDIAASASLGLSGDGNLTVGNLKAASVSFSTGSAAAATIVQQRAGTVVEVTDVYASLSGKAGSLLNLTNAGNKIGNASSIVVDGDVKITSSIDLGIGFVQAGNVKLQAPNIGGQIESGISASGNVDLLTTGAGMIDVRTTNIDAGANLNFASAADVVVGTVSANTLTATISGSLVQDPSWSSWVQAPGGVSFNVGGTIDLSGNPPSFTQNQLGYVTGSAGTDILLNGIGGVAAGGVSAGGNIELTAYNPVVLALAFVAPTPGDLDLVGNVTAGGSVTLASGSNVIVQDTSTVSGSSLLMNAPLTSVYGTLKPGGPGGIGSANVSGDLFIGGAGSVQLDVASLTSFDTLNVTGVATTDAAAALQLVDGTGGAVTGSFTPTALGSGSSLTFKLPAANWSVSGTQPYLVTIGAVPVLAPPPPPTGLEEQIAADQSLNQIATFATLFIQEAQAQQEEEAEEREIGKDDIVITETACK